jgi:hypothetical protein
MDPAPGLEGRLVNYLYLAGQLVVCRDSTPRSALGKGLL